MNCDNTFVLVDLDAIEANYDAIQKKAGVPVMAIIKADAYGHGAVQVAQLLHGKCGFFGVATLQEALQLRQAGIREKILVLGPMPTAAFPEAVAQEIRPVLFTWEDALALSEAACRQQKTAAFHFAVDTGMGRIGFPPTEESAALCAAIAKLPGLEAEGIFSHFACADSRDHSFAQRQAEDFDRFCRMLQERGVSVPLKHMNNSAGIIHFSQHYDIVRAGIILYGISPSDETNTSALALRPALQWHSRISHIKLMEAGRPIGYGATFVTTGPTRVATVAVGYGDGYRWNLSGRFYVLIRGKKAPILGRICMDQLMVDVSAIPDAVIGDTVVLCGTSGEETITLEQLSRTAGSFPYETACSISHRVPRFYYQNGILTETVHYLTD